MQNKSKITGLKTFHSFTRLEHAVFSLPLLFAGAWLGSGSQMPSARMLLLVAMAGIGARTMGMAANRIIDRDIDAANDRTKDRALASGSMPLRHGYLTAAAGAAIYLLACAALGRTCLILSPVPMIPLLTYSYLKRFTALCHFGIGVCLGLAPAGAFVAASNSIALNTEVILLSFFAFFWISGFDMIYGLEDMEHDRLHGIYSIPAITGSTMAQVISGIMHITASLLLMTIWLKADRGIVSGFALLVCSASMAAAYIQAIPVSKRFFPLSAIAGAAGALVPVLGGI